MSNVKQIDLTSGNLLKKLITVSLPLILSGILQLLYTSLDLIVCRFFGSEFSTAAITSTSSLTHLLINLAIGLSTGANILLARCYGENNKEKAERTAYSSMILALSSGIILGVFGFFFSKYFLQWMDNPDSTIDLATTYMKIYFIGLPAALVYNFGASLLRAIGDTKRPFIFLSIAGLLNVILNLLFVAGFKLDVAGVAIATAISQYISAVLIVICLIRNKVFFEFKLNKIRFYKKEALEISRIGIPAGIQGMIFSLSNVLIQSKINGLGEIVLGGNGAASNLEGYVYTSMNGISTAAASFVSANYGAKNFDNIKKIIKYSCLLILFIGIIMTALILPLNKYLLGLLVENEDSILYGRQRLMAIMWFYCLCGFMEVFAFSQRGIGYSVIPAITSLIGACVVRIIWIYTFFQMPSLNNIFGIAISYPISWLITTIAHVIIFILLFRKIMNKNKLQSLETIG